MSSNEEHFVSESGVVKDLNYYKNKYDKAKQIIKDLKENIHQIKHEKEQEIKQKQQYSKLLDDAEKQLHSLQQTQPKSINQNSHTTHDDELKKRYEELEEKSVQLYSQHLQLQKEKEKLINQVRDLEAQIKIEQSTSTSVTNHSDNNCEKIKQVSVILYKKYKKYKQKSQTYHEHILQLNQEIKQNKEKFADIKERYDELKATHKTPVQESAGVSLHAEIENRELLDKTHDLETKLKETTQQLHVAHQQINNLPLECKTNLKAERYETETQKTEKDMLKAVFDVEIDPAVTKQLYLIFSHKLIRENISVLLSILKVYVFNIETQYETVNNIYKENCKKSFLKQKTCSDIERVLKDLIEKNEIVQNIKTKNPDPLQKQTALFSIILASIMYSAAQQNISNFSREILLHIINFFEFCYQFFNIYKFSGNDDNFHTSSRKKFILYIINAAFARIKKSEKRANYNTFYQKFSKKQDHCNALTEECDKDSIAEASKEKCHKEIINTTLCKIKYITRFLLHLRHFSKQK